MSKVASPTIENALTGKVAGVNLQSNSGAPGGGIQMQIRGNTTILGASDPLYVIDGVIYSNVRVPSRRFNATAGVNQDEDDAVNRVADINPADIQSIEILKGRTRHPRSLQGLQRRGRDQHSAAGEDGRG